MASSIALPLVLGLTGAASVAGGIGSSLIGANASETAANEQVQEQQQALAQQQAQFNTTQANEAPWLQAGQVSLQQLMSGLQPGGQFATPFSGTFQPPTLAQAQQTPGYQFAQQQGEEGIEHGAAASGGAFNTNELQNLAGFNNNLAQNAYQQTYNNALNTFGTQFNTYNTNQSNLFNRLASSSGLGQTTATQLGQLGNQNTQQQANTLTNIGSSQAAGTIGAANAYNSGLGLITQGITGPLTLNALMGGGLFGGGSSSLPSGSGIPALNAAPYNANLGSTLPDLPSTTDL